MHIYAFLCIYMHVYAYLCVSMHIYACLCIFMHISFMHIYADLCKVMQMYTPPSYIDLLADLCSTGYLRDCCDRVMLSHTKICYNMQIYTKVLKDIWICPKLTIALAMLLAMSFAFGFDMNYGMSFYFKQILHLQNIQNTFFILIFIR